MKGKKNPTVGRGRKLDHSGRDRAASAFLISCLAILNHDEWSCALALAIWSPYTA